MISPTAVADHLDSQLICGEKNENINTKTIATLMIDSTSCHGLFMFTDLTNFTPPYFCACPKPGSGFLISYVMVFFLCV